MSWILVVASCFPYPLRTRRYRKEALRLDSFTTAMKKDLKYMKEKLESIEDDRNWLERQLKEAKKQNKLLRAGVLQLKFFSIQKQI